jgi:hypothetical protein
VYFLVSSLSNEIKYVGKGKGRRMYVHVKNVLRGKEKKSWKKYYGIRSIFRNHGKIIYFKYRENLTERQAFGIEKICIKKLGRKNLWNFTDGGEGSSGLKFNSEQIKRLSLAHIGVQAGKKHPLYGKHHSEEAKIKISLGNLGTKRTEEAKIKISLGNLGTKRTEETKRKMSLARLRRKKKLGYVNSPEAREKLRLANLGKRASKHTRLMLRIGWIRRRKKNFVHPFLGKHLSEEHKRNLSIAHKGQIFTLQTRLNMSKAQIKRRAA